MFLVYVFVNEYAQAQFSAPAVGAAQSAAEAHSLPDQRLVIILGSLIYLHITHTHTYIHTSSGYQFGTTSVLIFPKTIFFLERYFFLLSVVTVTK